MQHKIVPLLQIAKGFIASTVVLLCQNFKLTH